ncbi:MAG: response regulator [Gemmatimonadaceae bacterium]
MTPPVPGVRASRLLLVDDSDFDRKLIATVLAHEGYDIADAASGAECLAVVASFDPDLIVLDVMMPDMDGYAVCRRLRANPLRAKIPVLMVTGLADAESMVQGLEAGADDFLTKPFNKWELRARVASLIRLGVQQRALADHERFYWAVEHADDGFVLVDRADRILHCNATGRRFLGFGAHDPVEGLFVERLARDCVAHPADAWERWGDSDGRNKPFHLVRSVPGGRLKEWVLVTPHQNPDDPDGMVVVSLRDVSQQVERQMRQFEFHELVSHKLRTPLAGIVGAVDRLAVVRDELPGERERQMLDIVVRSTGRLREAVQDVLDFVGEGVQQETPTPVAQLASLVRAVAAEEHVATLDLDAPEETAGLVVSLGEVSVRAILRELMQNSVRFHPAHSPSVTVHIVRVGDGILRIEVEDDGIGLTPRQIKRAFEPYVQGDPELTGEVPGMGLGLSTVATRVWGVGGRCAIENCSDHTGVRVRLDVPLVTA